VKKRVLSIVFQYHRLYNAVSSVDGGFAGNWDRSCSEEKGFLFTVTSCYRPWG